MSKPKHYRRHGATQHPPAKPTPVARPDFAKAATEPRHYRPVVHFRLIFEAVLLAIAVAIVVAGQLIPDIRRHAPLQAYGWLSAWQRSSHVEPAKPDPAAAKPKRHYRHSPALTNIGSHAECKAGLIDVIVAHEDDDILFMNPTLSQKLTAGACLRTVYLTAGDGGHGAEYWQARESGVEAAYAAMVGVDDDWRVAAANLAGHEVVVANLTGRPHLSLVFLRLPDGSPAGTGYAVDHNQSLLALQAGTQPYIESIDQQASYTRAELGLTLIRLLQLDRPDAVYAQTYTGRGILGDHSDHRIAGQLASRAFAAYANPISSFTTFEGYPMREEEPNLDEADAAYKQQIFATYAAYDPTICRAGVECTEFGTYTSYFSRQYHSEPHRGKAVDGRQ